MTGRCAIAGGTPRTRRPGQAIATAFEAVALAATLVVAAAIPCAACPFCGVIGESLAQRRDRATCVAVGEPAGSPGHDDTGRPVQRMDVLRVVRGPEDVADGVVVARTAGPITGTAILFAEADGDRDEAAGGSRLAWSAIAADEALIVHVLSAPATTAPEPERLRWFARRLEHANPAIATDAFTEFGLAPYASVRAASDAFDGAALVRWIGDVGVDERRRGFYGLALGIVAATTDDPGSRDAARIALRDAIDAPADDFRAGFDGLLAGLLVADGARGLEVIERRGLLDAAARPVDQRHTLAALRFAWEQLADAVPRDLIAAATARLLSAPVTAADATIDLARYRHWRSAADVAALWDSLGHDDPLVRRAVAGYLAACPLPEARRALDDIRQRDPRRLERAMDAAALPIARESGD